MTRYFDCPKCDGVETIEVEITANGRNRHHETKKCYECGARTEWEDIPQNQ